MLHTLVYGASDLLSNDDNLEQKIKEYQNRSLLKKNFVPYNLHLYTDYNPQNININEELTAPQRRLAEGFLYTQAFMISTVVALWMMPESISKWDKDSLKKNH